MIAEQDTLRRLNDAGFLLQKALAPVVERHMAERFGKGWAVYASRARGSAERAPLDLYGLLKTLISNWNEVFQPHLPVNLRTFAYTALEGRNAAAHPGEPISHAAAIRYLDAQHELMKALKSPQTADVHRLWDAEVMAASRGDSAASLPPPEPLAAATAEAAHSKARQPALGLDGDLPTPQSLTPWRKVAFPRIDVIESRFQDAEYAADLSVVARGQGTEEYGTPAGFFRMTHPTVGLKRVLRSAIERLTDTGGDPVIGLQTSFGGGKTHTLLALYHLARATNPADLPVLRELVSGGTKWAPASTAVFVGFAIGPDMPFHQDGKRSIRTLWGWLAWQLAGADGLALVAKAEEAGTSPGSVALEALLTKAMPCLILLDEIVAYVRQLDDKRFESYLTFFQELTEAAKNVPGALVVGALPESATEAGGDKGLEALRRLEKIFGRIQSPWLPAQGVETYEIIRRRLFEPLDDAGVKTRDQTVKAFHDLYRKNAAEFPPQAKEAAYLDELRVCYPIHPELLGRLAKDWSALPKFQRTRGVLKLMAHIIATLWHEERGDPLIMPGRVPLNDERVRASLLDPIDAEYDAVLNREVEGASALPSVMESNAQRNISRARAVTRVARALFLCSVPGVGGANQGMTAQDVRLACAEPGEQIDVFGNALREFGERAAYLYEEAGRYWLSTKPTLNKLADDRARAYQPGEVEGEIVRMLREEQGHKGGFARVHAALDTPTDADDKLEVGLVILGPGAPHLGRQSQESAAIKAATDVLLRYRTGQRTFRNALVFLAADATALESARAAVRKALAWESIVKEADALTGSQRRDAADKAKLARQGAVRSLRAAWTHGLYPGPPPENGTGIPFVPEHTSVPMRNADKPLAETAFEKFGKDGIIAGTLGPDSLWNHLAPLWPAEQPHLATSEVAEWFGRYVYLPRLRDRVVLEGAIEAAVARTDPPFGLATVTSEGGYRDIVIRRNAQISFEPGRVLLRQADADRIIAEQQPKPLPGDGQQPGKPGTPTGTPGGPAPQPPPDVKPTRFFGTIELDPTRPVAKLHSIVDGILSELSRPSGAKVRLVLEIHADARDGFPADVVGVVCDNAKTLGFSSDSAKFEEK